MPNRLNKKDSSVYNSARGGDLCSFVLIRAMFGAGFCLHGFMQSSSGQTPVIEPPRLVITSGPNASGDSEIKLSEYHRVNRNDFREPDEFQRSTIESYVLELELLCRMTDRLGWIGNGQYYFASREAEYHATSLRQFAMSWAVDNQFGYERCVLVDQERLQPNSVSLNAVASQSSQTHLDRLRKSDEFHEAMGLAVFPAGEKSRLDKQFKHSGLFSPTIAAISHPLDCWSGRAIDRGQQFIDCDRLMGVQSHKGDTLALFCFRPASFYHYYITVYFKNGYPVQTDFWRSLDGVSVRAERASPSLIDEAEEVDQEGGRRKRRFVDAMHVATTSTTWKMLRETPFPSRIVSRTLHEQPEIELSAEFEWCASEQINPDTFNPNTVGKLAPFETRHPRTKHSH